MLLQQFHWPVLVSFIDCCRVGKTGAADAEDHEIQHRLESNQSPGKILLPASMLPLVKTSVDTYVAVAGRHLDH